MTHTYNGMKPLHHREAGSVGGALLCDDIYCEVIRDGSSVGIVGTDNFYP